MPSKQIINPSFLVTMLDVQDHLKDGWEIDPKRLPSHNFVYFEVNLVKGNEQLQEEIAEQITQEDKSILEVLKDTPARKPAGRPAKAKQ